MPKERSTSSPKAFRIFIQVSYAPSLRGYRRTKYAMVPSLFSKLHIVVGIHLFLLFNDKNYSILNLTYAIYLPLTEVGVLRILIKMAASVWSNLSARTKAFQLVSSCFPQVLQARSPRSFPLRVLAAQAPSSSLRPNVSPFRRP